jgi:hypothetical protein
MQFVFSPGYPATEFVILRHKSQNGLSATRHTISDILIFMDLLTPPRQATGISLQNLNVI